MLSVPRDISALLGWVEACPPSTLIMAGDLAEQLRALPMHERPAAPPAEPDPLLTADEVAAWLQIDKQAVYRMGRDGRLRSVRIGGNTVRFRRADVERWLERRTE